MSIMEFAHFQIIVKLQELTTFTLIIATSQGWYRFRRCYTCSLPSQYILSRYCNSTYFLVVKETVCRIQVILHAKIFPTQNGTINNFVCYSHGLHFYLYLFKNDNFFLWFRHKGYFRIFTAGNHIGMIRIKHF